MSYTVGDILGDADLFRAAYPRWPHAEPEPPRLEHPPMTTTTAHDTNGTLTRDESTRAKALGIIGPRGLARSGLTSDQVRALLTIRCPRCQYLTVRCSCPGGPAS